MLNFVVEIGILFIVLDDFADAFSSLGNGMDKGDARDFTHNKAVYYNEQALSILEPWRMDIEETKVKKLIFWMKMESV